MTTSVPANADDEDLAPDSTVVSQPDSVWTDMSYFRSKLVGGSTSSDKDISYNRPSNLQILQ